MVLPAIFQGGHCPTDMPCAESPDLIPHPIYEFEPEYVTVTKTVVVPTVSFYCSIRDTVILKKSLDSYNHLENIRCLGEDSSG